MLGFTRVQRGNPDRLIFCGLSRMILYFGLGISGRNMEFISHPWHNAVRSIMRMRTSICEGRHYIIGGEDFQFDMVYGVWKVIDR